MALAVLIFSEGFVSSHQRFVCSVTTTLAIDSFEFQVSTSNQTITKAEHNRPIPKFFGNRPLASATQVFGETVGLVIYI